MPMLQLLHIHSVYVYTLYVDCSIEIFNNKEIQIDNSTSTLSYYTKSTANDNDDSDDDTVMNYHLYKKIIILILLYRITLLLK